jgi:hypothetical protein
MDKRGRLFVGGQAVYQMTDRLTGAHYMGMDKLGRSGTAKQPTAGHDDPRIFECFKSVGIRAFQLCPKGCLFNAVEIANYWAQQLCERRWMRGRREITAVITSFELPNHGRDAQRRQYTGP